MADPSTTRREFMNLIFKASGKWANWDPLCKIKVGDYGKIDKNTGEFDRKGNIYNNANIYEDENIAKLVRHHPPSKPAGREKVYIVASANVKRRDLKLDAEIEIPRLADATIKDQWAFGSKRGALLIAVQPRISYMTVDLFEHLSKVQALKEIFIVTTALSCPACSFYLSSGDNEVINLALLRPSSVPHAPGSPVGGERERKWLLQNATGLFRSACDPHDNYNYTPLYMLAAIERGGKNSFHARGAGIVTNTVSGYQARINLIVPGPIYKYEQRVQLLERKNVPHSHADFDSPKIIRDSEKPSINSSTANADPLDISAFVIRDKIHAVGGGSYSDVYSGILKRDQKTMKVAIKVIRAHIYTEANQWKINKRLEREIRVWSSLQHPNVVPLLGVTKDFGPHPGMVCPWMSGGDLNNYLKKQKPHLNLRKRLQILFDVVEGLIYLHTRPIVHGDLTTANILMEDETAHLSDFGLPNIIAETQSSSVPISTVGGAVRWAAPELYHFDTEPSAIPKMAMPCDVYSFGSVALQVISGKIPYYNIASEVQVLLELTKRVYPPRPEEPLLTDTAWELITLCWTQEPCERPRIEVVRGLLQSLRDGYSAELLDSNVTS